MSIAQNSNAVKEYYSDTDNELNSFEIMHVSAGTYADDFEEADKIAKQTKGLVFTILNDEGSHVLYAKGKHWVDRIGVCVFIPIPILVEV